MKNQIFKTIIHPDILWEFLKNNGEEYTDYYVFSKNFAIQSYNLLSY